MVANQDERFWKDETDTSLTELEMVKQSLRQDAQILDKILAGDLDSSSEINSQTSVNHEDEPHAPFYIHNVLKRNASENDISYLEADSPFLKEGDLIPAAKSLNSSVERNS